MKNIKRILVYCCVCMITVIFVSCAENNDIKELKETISSKYDGYSVTMDGDVITIEHENVFTYEELEEITDELSEYVNGDIVYSIDIKGDKIYLGYLNGRD